MCGIVGYVGQRSVQDILLAGLEKLEYRGYDSAGISLQADGTLESVRAVGNLSALKEAVETAGESTGGVAVMAPPATTGIGHTRWATHGRVTEENAHPHYDPENRVHVVVNGIVENYMELKQELQASGAHFSSETDVEVIAHLIADRPRRARARGGDPAHLQPPARPLLVRGDGGGRARHARRCPQRVPADCRPW